MVIQVISHSISRPPNMHNFYLNWWRQQILLELINPSLDSEREKLKFLKISTEKKITQQMILYESLFTTNFYSKKKTNNFNKFLICPTPTTHSFMLIHPCVRRIKTKLLFYPKKYIYKTKKSKRNFSFPVPKAPNEIPPPFSHPRVICIQSVISSFMQKRKNTIFSPWQLFNNIYSTVAFRHCWARLAWTGTEL